MTEDEILKEVSGEFDGVDGNYLQEYLNLYHNETANYKKSDLKKIRFYGRMEFRQAIKKAISLTRAECEKNFKEEKEVFRKMYEVNVKLTTENKKLKDILNLRGGEKLK